MLRVRSRPCRRPAARRPGGGASVDPLRVVMHSDLRDSIRILDHRLHRPQSRLPDLRHAVRPSTTSSSRSRRWSSWTVSDDKLIVDASLRDGLE